MDDIAIVAHNLTQLKAAMNRISELSQILGFQVNPGKTDLYHWATKPHSARVIWNGQHIKARSPVFSYLGHMIAHPAHVSLARSQILAEVKSDLNRYKQLPLNAFERVQLVNSVLIPGHRGVRHCCSRHHEGHPRVLGLQLVGRLSWMSPP